MCLVISCTEVFASNRDSEQNLVEAPAGVKKT